MIDKLPLVNACINTAVAVLLLAGYKLIRARNIGAHKRVMLAALVLSALFLASYLTYHFEHGATKFAGQGLVRPIYFSILISHTVLAVANLPFIVLTVLRAWRGDFEAHRKAAKRTWAVWMYVAVTGPIVYLMLYQLYPPSLFQEAQEAHKAGDEVKALALYERAGAEGSRAARCYAAVIADRLHGTKTATAAIAQALAEAPSEPHCRVLSARELVYGDRAAEAVPILEAVTQAHGDNAFFWASLGFARFETSDYKGAAAAFEKSVALDPGQSVNVYNAAYAHYLYGDYKGAKPLFERYLAAKALDPEMKARAEEELGVITGALWVCPMHPEVTGKAGAKCPVCGMPLEPAPHGLSQD